MSYLKDHPIATLRHQAPTQATASYRRPPRRVRDRLGDRDVIRLIMAFRAGINTLELAERYGIGPKSMRRLLREIGIRKRFGFDIQQ